MKLLVNKNISNVLIVLLIILIANKIAYAQISKPLYKYYQLVNKAELSVIDSNFKKALQLFEKAFVYKQSPFAVDIYNAAVCAMMLKDYRKTSTYLTKVFEKGYSFANLKRYPAFNDFLESNWGSELALYCKNIKAIFS